jgi:hypothetical protein
MEKKLKLLPPMMPNFVFYESEPSTKQEGFKQKHGIYIKNFTKEEAEEYAELMKTTFVEHWQSRQPTH